MLGKDPASGRPVTTQSAPSSSTPVAAVAPVGATVSAPVSESVTATASATALVRRVMRLSLPGGALAISLRSRPKYVNVGPKVSAVTPRLSGENGEEPPPRTGDGSTQVGAIYAQDCSTIQLTSLAHEVALSKAFEPPLLAM